MPGVEVVFAELLLGDDEGAQALPGEVVALVLDVAAVAGLAFVYHDHVGAFQVEEDAVGCGFAADYHAHAFCLAGKWEVGEYIIFL